MLEKLPLENGIDEWKDNTEFKVEEMKDIQEIIVVMKEEKKGDKKRRQKKPKEDDENIEFSQNLVKVFERRYVKQPMPIDILVLVREYFTLCL